MILVIFFRDGEEEMMNNSIEFRFFGPIINFLGFYKVQNKF